jgi:chromosome segregation ATPase
MSMSVDTRQLETVVQFASFVEAITNPDALKETLKNVQAATADYKEKLGLITTKEEADSYLAQSKMILEEAKQYLAKEKAIQDANAAQVLADLTQKKEEATRTLDILSKRQADADNNLKETERVKAEANSLLVEAYNRQRDSALKAENLAALEKKLNEKQAKLNQILG